MGAGTTKSDRHRIWAPHPSAPPCPSLYSCASVPPHRGTARPARCFAESITSRLSAGSAIRDEARSIQPLKPRVPMATALPAAPTHPGLQPPAPGCVPVGCPEASPSEQPPAPEGSKSCREPRGPSVRQNHTEWGEQDRDTAGTETKQSEERIKAANKRPNAGNQDSIFLCSSLFNVMFKSSMSSVSTRFYLYNGN